MKTLDDVKKIARTAPDFAPDELKLAFPILTGLAHTVPLLFNEATALALTRAYLPGFEHPLIVVVAATTPINEDEGGEWHETIPLAIVLTPELAEYIEQAVPDGERNPDTDEIMEELSNAMGAIFHQVILEKLRAFEQISNEDDYIQ